MFLTVCKKMYLIFLSHRFSAQDADIEDLFYFQPEITIR